MPQVRVDFYLLSDSHRQARWLIACRLLEKAYKCGHRIYVSCQNEEDAQHLDELLWTFKEESFIPHNLKGEGPEPPPPIQIGFDGEPRGFQDILLNLAETIPPYFERFKRVMEIVAADDASKEQSREHYRSYRAKGCDLHTHQMD